MYMILRVIVVSYLDKFVAVTGNPDFKQSYHIQF